MLADTTATVPTLRQGSGSGRSTVPSSQAGQRPRQGLLASRAGARRGRGLARCPGQAPVVGGAPPAAQLLFARGRRLSKQLPVAEA